jgi:SOS-response transcriptional repressor LexA
MSLGQIIRDKREGLRLTLDEVAAKTGFSKPYLSTVETDKVNNPPSDNLLSKLELVLDFEQGLLQYIAHMERMPVDVRRDFEARDAENKKYRQIIRNLVGGKTDLGELGAVLGAEGLDVGGVEERITAGRLIPVINKVSAGYPVDFDDMGYPVGFADDYVRCPDLHDPNTFAVRVVGDSMEPKFREGDIVIFSPAVDVQNGDDCFVRFTRPHETTFKRVFFESDNRVRLQPRNQNYAPTIVEGERVNGIYKAVIRYESL